MPRKLFIYNAYSAKTWDDNCRLLAQVFAGSVAEARQLFGEQGIAAPVIDRSLGNSSYRLVDDNGDVIEEYKQP